MRGRRVSCYRLGPWGRGLMIMGQRTLCWRGSGRLLRAHGTCCSTRKVPLRMLLGGWHVWNEAHLVSSKHLPGLDRGSHSFLSEERAVARVPFRKMQVQVQVGRVACLVPGRVMVQIQDLPYLSYVRVALWRWTVDHPGLLQKTAVPSASPAPQVSVSIARRLFPLA